MDEFEEIHSGRRLVLEYPISVSTRVTVVVLDSASATSLEHELATECAAMLVPVGKELDWVYSSEGGQFQLLASAGVSRLILFSRTRYGEIGLTKIVTDERSTEDVGQLSSLRRVYPVLGTQQRTAKDEKAAKGRNRWGRFGRKRKSRGLLDRGVDRNRSGCGRKIEKIVEMVEAEEKTKHEDPRGEKRRGRVGQNSKQEEQQRQELLLDGSEPSLGSRYNFDDDTLKGLLGSLVIALAPRICFISGVPNIPFVSYADNVVQRVVVEEALSVLTGWIRVEDVELETEQNGTEEQQPPIQGQPNKEGSNSINPGPSRSWRRRLIFKRMPNLIQTEVLLHLCHKNSSRAPDKYTRSDTKVKRPRNPMQSHVLSINPETAVRCVDHNRLVHKYLPPIVAGFVLVSSCLDACSMSPTHRAHILSIGVGGGALPIFLQKHFQFHIQVVDLDETVLKLAKQHFGLEEDTYFQVTLGDGLAVVEEIAATAIQEGLVADKLKESWAVYSRDLRLHRFSDRPLRRSDPRVEVIIVDVDAADAQLDLSSPPLSFLDQRFLLSARCALQERGMLAMNVVPFGDRPYEGVVNALQTVFAEVYELALEDDLNRIVFALSSPLSDDFQHRDSDTVDKVKKVVGDQLIQHIRRIKRIS